VKSTAWFVSDIHLKQLNERNGNILLRFLLSIEQKERPATHLILLGDIFDLWVGSSEYYSDMFKPIVQVIERLVKGGVSVYYFEGNHDLHIEEFWQKRGVHVEENELYLDISPWKVRCEHGDLINQEEIAYQRLRKTLRHPVIEKLLVSAPANWLHWLGEQAAKKSRKRSVKLREINGDELREKIRSHAQKKNQEDYFDFIITGHMHVRDTFTFQSSNRTVTSINLGSWFDKPAALCLDENGARFVDLENTDV
jgi:UDP-2,3-diacylglucosamine hydrolase